MKPNDIIIEREVFATPPADGQFCAGGFLEEKEREVCLRLGDQICTESDGQIIVERSWRKPSSQPFDPDLYPSKP